MTSSNPIEKNPIADAVESLMDANFITISYLVPRPVSSPNYDAEGNVKRCKFGGVERARISSQSDKRRWRFAEHGNKYKLSEIDVGLGIRSRLIGEEIRDRAIALGADSAKADSIVAGLLAAGLLANPKKTKEEKEDDLAAATGDEPANEAPEADPKAAKADDVNLASPQAVLLGEREINYLADFVKRLSDPTYYAQIQAQKAEEEAAKPKKAAKEGKKKDKAPDPVIELSKYMFNKEKDNFRAIVGGAGLTAAFFGRFCTSDILAIVEGAVSVGHSFTVQPIQSELDYFTVMDDILVKRGDRGSAGIFNTEFVTGTFFNSIHIDVAQLISNLTGVAKADHKKATPEQRELVASAIANFIGTVFTVQGCAKPGPTAAQSIATFGLVEIGDSLPVSLAMSFETPIPLDITQDPNYEDGKDDVYSLCLKRINEQVLDLDHSFGPRAKRQFFAARKHADAIEAASNNTVAGILEWVHDAVVAGQVK